VASHGSGEETFVDRVENMPHYKEFNQASLTMLNRRDGPIAHLLQIMKDMDRTAIIAWKNFIYTSQTMPSRTSKKLSQEDHKEQVRMYRRALYDLTPNPHRCKKILISRNKSSISLTLRQLASTWMIA
jgi:regulatory protein YycH of two-component signal transduction system YycFG